ncbi:hypothetical protein [Cerasicoccus maritimus]|uniref:hypothetical protein n=1 Tax=Cerasicoccus maritimus TaxID=490089 RepID=UPI0028525F56|nr:hypothetical protein [Cerasicoccus maritimus]
MRRPAICILLLQCTLALIGRANFEIEELLGRAYGPELVSFTVPVDTPEKFQVHGAFGAIAHQQQGNSIYFISEPLARYETQTYALKSSQDDTSTDLSIKVNGESAVISTALISAKFPIGSGGKTPPPPLLGLRLGNGAWSSSSKWENAKAISSWSSKIQSSGPVFAKVRIAYQFDDGSFVSFTATLIAGDSAIYWRMASSGDSPNTVATFQLPTMPNVQNVGLPKGYGQWARKDRQLPVSALQNNLTKLSPKTSVLALFPNAPWRLDFANERDELALFSRMPGDWVTPIAEQTYYGETHWSLPMIEKMWAGWRACGMPVNYSANGDIELLAHCTRGVREWVISSGEPKIGRQLEHVLALTLEWKETAQHPLLFVDPAEIAEKRLAVKPRHPDWAVAALSLPTDATKAKAKSVIDKLRKQLELLGEFDVMRKAIATAGLYDALVDSSWLDETERRRIRAQMAYLAYILADPMCWSSERGYGSGNPNMHCSYILTLGVAACVLRDHPMSEQWANYAANWLDQWLSTEVGPSGEWIPEGSHYGNVSLEVIVSFAIASQRAGYRDFTNDPRLKQLITFFAQQYTPQDPARDNLRVTANYGRGVSSEKLATMGIAARMFAQSDPALSANLQWVWAETGYSTDLGDYRLGGFRYYYLDKELPSQAPEWCSKQFPQLGAIFRAGFNTPQESFVNFLAGVGSEHNLDVWTPSVTDIAQWYARGKPLSTCFTILTGTRERHELLSEGVQLARNYSGSNKSLPFGYYSTTDFSEFANLPSFDYARTQRTNTKPDNRNWLPPDLPTYPKLKPAKSDRLTIDRQVAFIHEPDNAAGPAYLAIRDTATGGEPTTWQFWTLTEGLTTPDAPEADTGGEKILPARKLPDGDHYAAQGQFGVNLDYFIASPSKTPRYTLRYGGNDQIHRNQTQYQDLLHLQRPNDGAYFLALFPSLPGEPTPSFAKNRDETIIRVNFDSCEDYIFLIDHADRSKFGEAEFHGTSGCIQVRATETTLSLGAAGQVAWKNLQLDAEMPASIRVTTNRLYIDTSSGGKLTITAPGNWSRVKGLHGPTNFRKTLHLTLPTGEHSLIFKK